MGRGHLRKEIRGRNYRQIRQCHGRSHSSHFGPGFAVALYQSATPPNAVHIRCKGLKYVIADSAFKRLQVDARACWLDTDKHRGVSLRFWISQERQGVVSWFEFIDFRCDIVVGSLFGGHQFLGKAAPKITLRCFHQPGHQIFWHSVDRSILIDFGVD
jgi:hypothetical protein